MPEYSWVKFKGRGVINVPNLKSGINQKNVKMLKDSINFWIIIGTMAIFNAGW